MHGVPARVQRSQALRCECSYLGQRSLEALHLSQAKRTWLLMLVKPGERQVYQAFKGTGSHFETGGGRISGMPFTRLPVNRSRYGTQTD